MTQQSLVKEALEAAASIARLETLTAAARDPITRTSTRPDVRSPLAGHPVRHVVAAASLIAIGYGAFHLGFGGAVYVSLGFIIAGAVGAHETFGVALRYLRQSEFDRQAAGRMRKFVGLAVPLAVVGGLLTGWFANGGHWPRDHGSWLERVGKAVSPDRSGSIPVPLLILAGIGLVLVAAAAASYTTRQIHARRHSRDREASSDHGA